MRAKIIDFCGTDGTGKTTAYDYFCDQLEIAGFKTRRIYGSSGDLYNYWGGTLPGDGAWHFYTEGWGSSGISLTSVWAWAQMYTDIGVGAPPYTYMTEEWCDDEFGEGFYSAAEDILYGYHASLKERLRLDGDSFVTVHENQASHYVPKTDSFDVTEYPPRL